MNDSLDSFAGIPGADRKRAKLWFVHPYEFLGSPKLKFGWLEECIQRENIWLPVVLSRTRTSCIANRDLR